MAKIAEHGATVLAHHPLPVPGLLGVRHRIRGPCPDILMRVSHVCVCAGALAPGQIHPSSLGPCSDQMDFAGNAEFLPLGSGPQLSRASWKQISGISRWSLDTASQPRVQAGPGSSCPTQGDVCIPALPSNFQMHHSEMAGGNSFETKGTGMKGPSPGNSAHSRAWPLGTLLHRRMLHRACTAIPRAHSCPVPQAGMCRGRACPRLQGGGDRH